MTSATLSAHPSCPESFFLLGSKCFYMSSDIKLTWPKAREWCGQYGGDLAEPDDPANFISEIRSRDGKSVYYAQDIQNHAVQYLVAILVLSRFCIQLLAYL